MPKKQETSLVPKEEKIADSELSLLNERVEQLETRIIKLEAEKSVITIVPKEPIRPSAPVVDDFPAYPIPADFAETVDIILNKSFKVRCEPLQDSPAFKLTIVVPEKYSSMTPALKEMIHQDARVKVIPFSEGVSGVRQWADMVYTTFNKTTQMQIVEDRPFATR